MILSREELLLLRRAAFIMVAIEPKKEQTLMELVEKLGNEYRWQTDQFLESLIEEDTNETTEE